MYKKPLYLFLAILLAMLAWGCASSKKEENSSSSAPEDCPTLTVFTDSRDYTQVDLKRVLNEIPGYGKNFKVEFLQIFDGLDNQREAREGAVQNARLDLVSGGGADIYICESTIGLNLDTMVKGTFTYPQSAMDQRFFLLLNQYLDNAKYMDLDNMFPQIIKGGQTKDGQVVIPLTFTVYVTLFQKDKFDRPASLPVTWKEQFASDDLGMKIASRGAPFSFSDRLGCMIDYTTDELTFSEDELQQYVEDFLSFDTTEMLQQGETIGFVQPGANIGPSDTNLFPEKRSGRGKKYVMLPTYNRTGGVTAYITSYAAINRNTKYPEYAFAVLDRLAGRDVQQEFNFGMGMPAYKDLGGSDGPLGKSQWTLSDWNMEQYLWICDQINQVDYYTELNVICSQMIYDCLTEMDEESQKAVVSKAYSEMKMIAGEI